MHRRQLQHGLGHIHEVNENLLRTRIHQIGAFFTVVAAKLFGWILARAQHRPQHRDKENGPTQVKRPLHGVRNRTGSSGVAHLKPVAQHVGQCRSHHRSYSDKEGLHRKAGSPLRGRQHIGDQRTKGLH